MTSKEIQSVSSADGDSVMTQIDVKAPPERVFKALINQGELVRWFTDANNPHVWEMDARLGGHYRCFSDEKTAASNAFEFHGEIIEFDPPRRLAYTWIASWHADPSRRTVVRWELTGTATGTHVKITHSGLANEEAAHKDYQSGWPGAVKMLHSFVEREISQ